MPKRLAAVPFKREELLSAFGVEDRPSQRLDGSLRSSRMSFTETWEHPSGLTITAYDSEYAGDLKIVPGSIDSLINDPGRKPTDFIGDPGIGPPRKSFEQFVISQGDKMLFRSNENQCEQGVRGQPATTPRVGD